MQINTLTLVGIALAAMFFGYFFGLFEGRGQGYRKRKKEEPVDRQVPPPDPAASEATPKSVQSQALLELDLNEAGHPRLRIDGGEVDAQRVPTEQRRRLIELMVMLKPWVDPGGATASTPTRVERASQVPAGRGRASAETVAAMPTPPAPAVADSQMSLVAQIDGILQARLAGTPLEARAIRLAETLHGGATVFVGSTQYEGVDQVSDPEIQSAIRAAIAEWENKYTPG